MPAIGNITVADGKATPTNHTFEPQNAENRTGELVNRSASIILGSETLSLEMRKPASSTGAYRLIGKMSFPVVASVAGVDTVVRTGSATFEINFSQSSTAIERKDQVVLLKNVLGHATVVEMAEKFSPLY